MANAESRPPDDAALIRFKCVCGKNLIAKTEAAGKKGKCPNCGRRVEIPSSPTPKNGPRLGPQVARAPTAAGKECLMYCPKCGQVNDENALACIRCGQALRPFPYAKSETSGKAIAAMVISMAGFFSCWFVGDIIGIFLGYNARREIRLSHGRLTGEPFATAAIVIGWVALGLHVLLAIFWVALFAIHLIAESL